MGRRKAPPWVQITELLLLSSGFNPQSSRHSNRFLALFVNSVLGVQVAQAQFRGHFAQL